MGKILIPDEILKKESSLSETEWEKIRRHPVSGANLAAKLGIQNRHVIETIQKISFFAFTKNRVFFIAVGGERSVGLLLAFGQLIQGLVDRRIRAEAGFSPAQAGEPGCLRATASSSSSSLAASWLSHVAAKRTRWETPGCRSLRPSAVGGATMSVCSRKLLRLPSSQAGRAWRAIRARHRR